MKMIKIADYPVLYSLLWNNVHRDTGFISEEKAFFTYENRWHLAGPLDDKEQALLDRLIQTVGKGGFLG